MAAPVINPKIAELRTTLNRVFGAAHDEYSTLLIAFIGHWGHHRIGRFHLLTHNSPAASDAGSAFHLCRASGIGLNRSVAGPAARRCSSSGCSS
ncbi:MAG: hypothetical protein M3143_01810 [Actinomycetota bacterium]|nr:hypothetical protein [Actinomycetota bacterium]